MRLSLRLVNSSQAVLLAGKRKTGVVIPAMPTFLKIEKIVCGIPFVIDIGVDGTTNRIGAKQNTMRVLQYRELQLPEPIPNVLGKTRADQKKSLPIFNGHIGLFNMKRELPLHNQANNC
jgi:hypothetical protein